MRRVFDWLWRTAKMLARDVYEFGMPPAAEPPEPRRGFEVVTQHKTPRA